jgi:hypothetical protein
MAEMIWVLLKKRMALNIENMVPDLTMHFTHAYKTNFLDVMGQLLTHLRIQVPDNINK